MNNIKVQLIQPPRNDGYVDNSRSACYAPLGLISIATCIKEIFPEIEVEILDGELLSIQKILSQLQSNALVGIESKMLNYASAITIAEEGKKLDCTIIFGGCYATAISEVIIKNRSAIVDHAICGYGEKAMIEIIRDWHKPKKELPVILRYPNPDFNNLPIANRKLFIDLERYIQNFQKQHPGWSEYRATNIFTQRGCKHRCYFCAREKPENEIYFRDPELIWQEVIKLNAEFGINYLVSFDDQITQDKEWLRRLIVLKPTQIPKVKWHVFSNAQNITEETLDLLEKLPACQIFMGIETGELQLAQKIEKGNSFSPEICLEAIKMIVNRKISLTPSFVLGLKGETKQSLQKTYDLARQIQKLTKFKEVFAACLIPFPGSTAFKQLVVKEPKYVSQDILDGEELTRAWFENFCAVSYEIAREFSAKILDLGKYKITLDKGGYKI